MSNALQEKAVERVESFIPTASIQVDPERESTYSLRLFEVWDQAGRIRGRFTTDADGRFVGGTVRMSLSGEHQVAPFQDLSAFLTSLRVVGSW